MRGLTMQATAYVFFLILLLAGCAPDKVAVDLVTYVNQGVLRIADLERVSLERYAAVTGPNYTTDTRVYEALRDEVIPTYKRFLDALRTLRPETDEVRRLQGIYVLGAEYLYEGFREKMYGIEKKDESIILSANQKIEKGRIENEKWRKELVILAEAHAVKQEEKEK